ncbi:PH domain-containing protein [Eupransor demetentiae]|uniref:SHOCT domain-containing protein n=1 Tax=Eupransor demetentiae TaxID=3109584 RepID=A0ABM9N2W1_9LACO|nr:hypothetical protein R54876_GBNLAHCA_00036 [Lactobacillaceae bacterium LMG 33000]
MAKECLICNEKIGFGKSTTVADGHIDFNCASKTLEKPAAFSAVDWFQHHTAEECKEIIESGQPRTKDQVKEDNQAYKTEHRTETQKQHDEDMLKIKAQMDAAGVSDLFGTKKEVRHLLEILRDNETILYATSGFSDSKTVLVVLTDQRLVFVNNNWTWGSDFKEFPFNHINSVSYSKKLVLANVAITNGANTTLIENVSKETAPILVDKLRQAMDSYDNKSSQPQAESQDDSFTKIRKLKSLLDEGIITQEEFDVKKKQLLGL